MNGKVRPSSSKIIEEIARKLGKTAKAAQLLLKRKYDQTKENQKKEKKDEKKTLTVNAVAEVTNDAAGSSQNLIEGDICLETFCKTFNVEGPPIFEIESRNVKHRNKEVSRVVVKPGWTSKLALFLWNESKLSCKFDFKVAHVTKDYMIKVKAGCSCGSVLEVSCHKSELTVDIQKINKIFGHNRRYQATGEMKKDLLEALKHNSALKVQTNKVNELIPDNETLEAKFIPVLQNLNTYRVMKCIDKGTDEDPIEALLNWKESIYKNVITLVSISPFTVHYRTALQLAWYVAHAKKNRISVSLDATGSLIRPPRRSQKIDGSEKLKHVFLYSVMAKTASKSVQIAQMITQDQSSENIEFFLKKMFKFPIKAPIEFVCDDSKALLKALVSTFTTCDGIVPYIEQCMTSLQTGASPPKCQIRLDRSHFIKNIARKIKYRDHRKCNFYRCVIGYLHTCDDFNIVKKILLDFFTIMLNEYDGVDDSNEPLPAEISRIRLMNLVGTHNADADYVDVDDSNEWNEESEIAPNSEWIDEIIKKVHIVTTGTHLSLFYTKDISMYVKLFSTIVLWSNIMIASFGSTAAAATSSDVESSFNALKNGILAGKMLKAHTFVKTHVEFVNAEVKLSAISTNNHSEEPQKRKRSSSLTETPPSKMRNRSNSNQYEQEHYPHNESCAENGKNKKVEIYDLVHSIYKILYSL